MVWFAPELVKAGRLTELKAMDHLEAGTLLKHEQAHALAADLEIAIVNSRRVLTSKTIAGIPDQCRARCVAQQIASGASSAQNLGISSSTPSAESFRAFLAMVAHHDMVLAGLDISTAFLHSDLPRGHRAIIKLPSDVSWAPDHCQSVYIDLAKAMSGLRIASKAWLQTCSRILRDSANLWSCPSEPTIMAGIARKSLCPVITMTYVDDLLIGALSVRGVDDVRESLEQTLKVKQTGFVTNSQGDGGILKFLGKEITRPKGSSNLFLRVPPSYLEDLFVNEPFCSELRATQVSPDIQQVLEAGTKDPSIVIELSDEAAARYKKIIGKLAWWCQSRPDHARFLSLLATGQGSISGLFGEQRICFNYFLQKALCFQNTTD